MSDTSICADVDHTFRQWAQWLAKEQNIEYGASPSSDEILLHTVILLHTESVVRAEKMIARFMDQRWRVGIIENGAGFDVWAQVPAFGSRPPAAQAPART